MTHMLLRTPPPRRPPVKFKPDNRVTAWTVAASLVGGLLLLGAISAAVSLWGG